MRKLPVFLKIVAFTALCLGLAEFMAGFLYARGYRINIGQQQTLYPVSYPLKINNRETDFLKSLAQQVPGRFADSRALSLNPKSKVKSSRTIKQTYEDGKVLRQLQIIDKANNRTIADITNLYYANGFRAFEVESKYQKADNFVALFGCSNTMGAELPEKETLSQYLTKKLAPKFNVYNYGISGGSPNVALHALQAAPPDLFAKIKEEHGYFVYLFYDYHLKRTNCGRLCLSDSTQWMWNLPHFKKTNDEYQFIGLFKESQTLYYTINFLLKSLSLPKLFVRPSRPESYTKKEITTFAELTKKLSEEFAKQSKKKIQSSLVIFPPQAEMALVEQMEPILRDNDLIPVRLLLPLDMQLLTEGLGQIPIDMHPTGKYNIVIAEKLADLFQ